jgi:ASC-1-like (ASCH) protein
MSGFYPLSVKKWFDKIKAGKKTVEIRPNVGKYANFKRDDMILFLGLNPDDKIKCRIISVAPYTTYEELIDKEKVSKVFPGMKKDEAIDEISRVFPLPPTGLLAFRLDKPLTYYEKKRENIGKLVEPGDILVNPDAMPTGNDVVKAKKPHTKSTTKPHSKPHSKPHTKSTTKPHTKPHSKPKSATSKVSKSKDDKSKVTKEVSAMIGGGKKKKPTVKKSTTVKKSSTQKKSSVSASLANYFK